MSTTYNENKSLKYKSNTLIWSDKQDVFPDKWTQAAK